MNNQKQTKTAFVGLSGGVDSSVAALRLLRAGYEVVGVFIKVWQPDWLTCNWEQERLDAMRVAAKLGIPFLTCDAEAAYRDDVAHYFIKEYEAGRTPNPDVMCNKYVKFGTFLEFAKAHGADYVATGHYARREAVDTDYSLWRGVDTNKDQSYFLWTLTQDQLRHILLPVGDSTKQTIRAEAEAAGLITAGKKDSQGICFLGHIDIPEFLSHYIDLKPGDVLDESGAVIGVHQGAVVYTVGQRHGFTLKTTGTSTEPHYVIDRDITENTITVSTKKPTQQAAASIVLEAFNGIAYTPTLGDELSAQTRYRQTPATVRVTDVQPGTVRLEFAKEAESVSLGQSCVLYRRDQCVGGGIIQECL